MAKFKVGDVVRVRDDLHNEPHNAVVTDMEKLHGQTLTITTCLKHGETDFYRVKESTYNWTDDMFYDCVVKPAPAPEPEFKPGDYVKVAYEGKIVRGPDEEGDYLIEVMGLSDYVPPQYITKIKVDDDTSGLLNPRRKGLAEVTD